MSLIVGFYENAILFFKSNELWEIFHQRFGKIQKRRQKGASFTNCDYNKI